MNLLASFHFLRSAWLLLLLPALLMVFWIWRRQSMERVWGRIMAPHLLERLLVSGEGRRPRWQPLHGLALFWLLGAIALAGPAWERVPAPFGEDRAPIIVLLKATPSMLAKDIQPSRLERAVLKLHDLLERRPGALTALIAYSGSAHLVMPLTRDARIIELFAAEISPDILPKEGDAVASAVALANARLKAAGLPGSIVLFADSVAPDQLDGLKQQGANGGAPVQILAVAAGTEVTPPPNSPPATALDRTAMEAAAEAGSGSLVTLTADDSDVERLARLVERRVSSGKGDEEAEQQWRDAGYYLLPLLVLLALWGFRRGWVVTVQ
jgi:Ca-activated chloride channel family protein